MALAAVALLGIACVAVGSDDSEAADNGLFASGVTWALDENGTLTISGTGAMDDYSYNDRAPWGTSITGVTISDA